MVNISNIKARGIMQTKVVTLSPSTPIQSAIETFEDLHISGAPVVDEKGTIVGMLSAIDVAKAEHIKNDAIELERGDSEMLEVDEDEPISFDEVFFSFYDFSATTTGRTPVSEWMSSGIILVDPDCALLTICRLMVKEHIHRVPVVKDGKLEGIISTLDIVRCIAGEPKVRRTKPVARRVRNLAREQRRQDAETRPASRQSSTPRKPAVHRQPTR